MHVGCGHIVQMLENYGKCRKLKRSSMPEGDSDPSIVSLLSIYKLVFLAFVRVSLISGLGFYKSKITSHCMEQQTLHTAVKKILLVLPTYLF